jgi:hypothetical protein
VANACEGAPDGSCPCLEVTPDGNDDAAVAENGLVPFRSVQAAIDFAATHRAIATNVCVAAGADCAARATFPGPSGELTMRDGIGVYGSYESTFWTQCSGATTTLAPQTAAGVVFDSSITTRTTLNRFNIVRHAAATTTAASVRGSQGAALTELTVPMTEGLVNVSGVEISGGAFASIIGLSIQGANDPSSTATGEFIGVRSVDSGVELRGSTIDTWKSGARAVGVWLENSPSSRVIGTTVTLRWGFEGASAELVGIVVTGGSGLVVESSAIQLQDGISAVGVDLADAGLVNILGTSITARSPVLAFGVRAIRSSVELDTLPGVSLWSDGVGYGVRLEDGPGSTVSGSASGVGTLYGVSISGNATGIVVSGAAAESAEGAATGVLIENCSGVEPRVGGFVSASGTTDVQGVRVTGNCRARIEGATISAGGVASSLAGVSCSGDCSITDNTISLTKSSQRMNMVASSSAVACSGCTIIARNTINGLALTSLSRSAIDSTTGIDSDATLISENLVGGGCAQVVTGVRTSGGRVENNVIFGGSPCGNAATLDGSRLQSVGLETRGSVDVSSNTIWAGSVVNGSIQGCRSAGLLVSGGGRYRNNIIHGGTVCNPLAVTEFAYMMQTPIFRGDPAVFAHNDVLGDYLDGTFDGGSQILSGSETNALSGTAASGNFSADPLHASDFHLSAESPCIDSGSTLGAPTTDWDGDARDESPDIGADEWTGAPSPCRGVDCSDHGVCRNGACVCDPTYGGPHCEQQLQCAIDNGGCDPLTWCFGGFDDHICGPCPTGYTGDGYIGCTDIDECVTGQHDCVGLSVCVNQPGSFICVCPPGYSQSNGSCDDIDECQTDNGDCDPLTVCTNIPGSRTCGTCPSGYTGSGETGCTDIDECSTNNGGCTPPAVCENLPGSSTCFCPPGYTGTPETGCVNTNECATNNGGCDPLTTCTDTPGGRSCGACPAGYYGTGETGCSASCPCEHGGMCTTPEGEYTCACQPTFAGSRCEIAFVSVATGESHACGLRSDGQIVCWGYDILGPRAGTFSAVAAGSYHSCAIHADGGAIECWGQSLMAPPSGAFIALAAGTSKYAAIAVDGTLSGWLYGVGVMPSPPAGTFKQLAGSFSRFCAIGTDDLITCFGDFEASATPPSGTAISVGDGLAGSCAVMTDGSLACWFNGFNNPSPPEGTFKAVSVGWSGACAIASDDTLVCFGGDGTITSAPAGTFKSVSVGYTYACAIATDDELVCWGTDQGGFGVLTPPY